MTEKVKIISAKSNNFLTRFVKKPFFVLALVIVPLGPLSITPPAPSISHNSLIALSDTVLEIDEEIVFTFDAPQDPERARVRVSPYKAHTIHWSDDYTALHVKPSTTWDVATDYTVALGEIGSIVSAAMYHFTTENYPEIISYHSDDFDGANFILESGSTVTYKFDRLAARNNVHAIVRPHIPHEITIAPDERTATLTFTQEIPQATHVDVILYATLSSDVPEGYPIARYGLQAFPRPDVQWHEDRIERVLQSAAIITPQITDGKYIDVNLTARITTLFEDGEIVEQLINSPGAEETPTPTGRYKIENKATKPLSQSFNVYLPHWLAFTADGLYGFHGLVEWPVGHEEFPDGGKESKASIDNAVSPGCVRHTDDISKRLYDWAPVDTPVIIYE